MNDSSFCPRTSRFSASYSLVENAEVVTHEADEAVMDYEMYDKLARSFPDPLIAFVDGLHYQVKKITQIPAGTVAVPGRNHDNPKTLLIQL